MKLHQATPIHRSFKWSKALKKEVYYKMDCYQPSGSFKIRGIGKLCSQLAQDGAQHFVIASGGNAGCAVAYAGWKLGIPTTVVVPESTGKAMQERLVSLGARLEIRGKVWDEAHAYATLLAQDAYTHYVHPFDHPLLWEGHASMIEEAAQEMEEPDLIILSVGGGGLFCGVMLGLEKVGWNNTKVLCVETEGAASLHKSLLAKEIITLDAINSIASSLGAKRVAQQTFDYAQAKRVHSTTVTDQESVEGMSLLLDEYQVLVEPACGAALAACYAHREIVAEAKRILVIVCGGSAVDGIYWNKLQNSFLQKD